jgi:very-short-patch-repair endonuclease
MMKNKNPPAKAPAKPRNDQENAERIFWNALNGKRFHGFKFIRNFAIGPYSAGFVCLTAKLVVDIDGGKSDSRKDAARTAELKKQGYGMLRFMDTEVASNLEDVLHSLLKQLRKAGDYGPQ